MEPLERSRSGAVAVALLLVVSTAPATALLGVGYGHATPAAVEASDGQYVDVSDDVRMWERALFPLRTDPAAGATVVDNGNVFVDVRSAASGDVPANKRTLAVYDRDAAVPVEFGSVVGAGTEGFAGTDVHLLVAKVDGGGSTSVSLASNDFAGAVDRATDLLDGRADGVEYELVDAGSVDSEGAVTVIYDLGAGERGAGQYAFFLVANGGDGDGFAVDDTGDLSVTGDATVLGFDAATAHRRPSDVAPTDGAVERGENATFAVSGSGGDADLDHTVVLYDESTYRESRTQFTVDGSMADGISEGEVAVERSVDRVNGVVRAGDQTGGDAVGSTDFGALVDLVESGPGASVGDASEGEAVVLDASVTRRTAAAPATLSVGTLDDWSTGEYRWVHLATDDDGSLVSSATGSIELTDGDGGDLPRYALSMPSSNSVEARIVQEDADDRYRLAFEGRSPTRDGVTVTGLDVRMREHVGRLSVTTTLVDGVPSDVPRPPTPAAGVLSVETDAPESAVDDATVHLSLSDDRFDALGVSSEAATLYRYHDGEWRALDARSEGDGQFAATTPGFSYFAVGASPSATASLSVTDVSLDRTDVSAGESVTLAATVENDGNATGSTTLDLTVDGERVDAREVELGPGESTTERFVRTFDGAGTYELAVAGADGVRVTVDSASEANEGTSGAAAGATGADAVVEGEGTDGGGWLPLGALLAVVVVALAGGGVYYRR